MTRTDDDRWDPATSVGATATMVAAGRAVVSKSPGALIDDPYAEALVRAVGIDALIKLVDDGTPDDELAKMLTDIIAVRTRFFDDFFLDAAARGVRQAVILASGLDSRAYRLPWPDGTTVFEIDQPAVIDFKTSTLARIAARPAAGHRTVGVDLRDDWPAALRGSGFDDTRPAAWSAEGLLVYLPPDAQDRLFDDITALSAPGSRLATEYHPDGGSGIGQQVKALREQRRQAGLGGGDGVPDIADLFYQGDRNSVVDYLSDRGWQVSARRRPDVFAGYGMAFPDTEALAAMRHSLAVEATREGK